LLRFDTSGTLDYSAQIGASTTAVSTNSVIHRLIAPNVNMAYTFFDGTSGGNEHHTISILTLDGATAEQYKGLQNLSDVALIAGFPLSATELIVFSVHSNKILFFYYSNAAGVNPSGLYITDDVSNFMSTTNDQFFAEWPDQTKGWLVAATSAQEIYGFRTTIAASPAVDLSFKISSLSSNVQYITDSYADDTTVYVYAMLSDNIARIYLVTVANADPLVFTIAVKRKHGTFSQKWYVGIKLASGVLLAGTKVGAESASLSSNQGIIYKTSDQFQFTDKS
jgi:hypothetical protein